MANGIISWIKASSVIGAGRIRRGTAMAAIRLTETQLPDAAAMGVAVEGSTAAVTNGEVTLPQFDSFNRQKHYIEVFNKGKTNFDFTIQEVIVDCFETGAVGSIEKDKRLWVRVDWNKAPKGASSGTIKITGAGGEVKVNVNAFNPTEVTRDSLQGFVEGEGFVSIEPENFTKNTDAGQNRWLKIQDYGRTLSGMRATQPVDAPARRREKTRRASNTKYICST